MKYCLLVFAICLACAELCPADTPGDGLPDHVTVVLGGTGGMSGPQVLNYDSTRQFGPFVGAYFNDKVADYQFSRAYLSDPTLPNSYSLYMYDAFGSGGSGTEMFADLEFHDGVGTISNFASYNVDDGSPDPAYTGATTSVPETSGVVGVLASLAGVLIRRPSRLI